MSDYISRADAICEVLVNDGIDNIVDRINALPSADAKGVWIKRGTKITCSNCKCAWSTSFEGIIVGLKFCPMCGAYMTKDGDDK